MPKLIETIENTIDSEDFQKRHRESSKDFTGSMTFQSYPVS
ncbi:hypothetical protein [Desulfobacterium sp. N47]|uniref:Uncharacterized protein n=1 Tax=uncultured Desulfobacterium sp. TaxID=201089 RepID=E1YEG4_9BACT|nr:unknown protein [uncultured Desulfobacterium sp.]CBX30523.1 unknown protein [uncultured Desulfobacterium sp.]